MLVKIVARMPGLVAFVSAHTTRTLPLSSSVSDGAPTASVEVSASLPSTVKAKLAPRLLPAAS